MGVGGHAGPQRLADGAPDPQAGDIDLATVGDASAADAFTVILEALAALRPDLIVSPAFSADPADLWDDAVRGEIGRIAPTAGILHVGRPYDRVLARYVDLAAALGADVEAPAVVEDRRRFDDAAAALREATAAKPGLTGIFVAASSDALYVVHPRADSPVWFYTELGLDVVVPDVPVADYWHELSWELVATYPADLIFHSVRSGEPSLDEMLARPTFAALPAVRAGQLAPWRLDAPHSHRHYAPILEEIAAAVRAADPTVV